LGEQYKSFSSSLCNLLHSPVTSSLLGPNILLNTMFSNTLSFLSSSPILKLIKYKITVFNEVYIVFHFKLKHNGMSSTKKKIPA